MSSSPDSLGEAVKDSMTLKRRTRVLIAKLGLDGHDRGAKVVARGLRDAGMEVIYLGLRVTPAQIAEAAVQEDVDVVGLSCLSGAHMSLIPRVVSLTREKTNDRIVFIVGGIIPNKDVPRLKELGVSEIFGPGTTLEQITQFIENETANDTGEK
jgi:methylmalonyl-CoA mutase, C-terminal domain